MSPLSNPTPADVLALPSQHPKAIEARARRRRRRLGHSQETWVARFTRQIRVNDESGCWEWVGALDKGYGVFSMPPNGNSVLAHRWSFLAHKGFLPDLQLDHLCMNKRCVNPSHLDPVENRVNSRRYWAQRATCRNGHVRTILNTQTTSQGFRRCLDCERARHA